MGLNDFNSLGDPPANMDSNYGPPPILIGQSWTIEVPFGVAILINF